MHNHRLNRMTFIRIQSELGNNMGTVPISHIHLFLLYRKPRAFHMESDSEIIFRNIHKNLTYYRIYSY